MHDSAFHSGDSIQGSPDIGATVTVDPSRKYRAAIEEYKCSVSKNGVIRIWNNWRDNPGKLITMLHGAWMLSENIHAPAVREIDFLIEVLEAEKNEN